MFGSSFYELPYDYVARRNWANHLELVALITRLTAPKKRRERRRFTYPKPAPLLSKRPEKVRLARARCCC